MRGLRLDIDGRKAGNRYLVQVNDRAVYLPASQFIILAVLALERRRKGGDGWVDARVLVYPPKNATRYIYLLRNSIAEGLVGTKLAKWKVVEASGHGRHRLLLEDPNAIRFTNLQALIDLEHIEITRRLRGKLRVL